MRYLLPIVAILSVTGCDTPTTTGPNEPPGQTQFIQQIEALAEKYDQAKDSGNDLVVQEVENEIEKKLRETNRRAKGWVGTVEEVSAYGENVTVTLINESQSYHLEFLDPKLKELAKALTKGKTIFFSGNLGKEVSFTLSGAVTEPEFRFPPSSIRRTDDDAYTQQDPALIKAEKAEDAQAIQNSEEKAAVMEACQAAVRADLKHPESADFSWMSSGFGKTDNGQWIYEDIVEAPNDLGATLEKRFRCIADTRTDDGKRTVTVTGWAFVN